MLKRCWRGGYQHMRLYRCGNHQQFSVKPRTAGDDRLKAKIGSQQTVLIDTATDEQIIARSKSDAPEIDGLVYLPANKKVKVGNLETVTIVDSDDYDLYGEWA